MDLIQFRIYFSLQYTLLLFLSWMRLEISSEITNFLPNTWGMFIYDFKKGITWIEL